jgi:hypothetical protein
MTKSFWTKSVGLRGYDYAICKNNGGHAGLQIERQSHVELEQKGIQDHLTLIFSTYI